MLQFQVFISCIEVDPMLSSSHRELTIDSCLSVCLSTCGSVYMFLLADLEYHMAKLTIFLYTCCLAMAQSSSSCVTIYYLLPVLRMTSCIHSMDPLAACRYRSSVMHMLTPLLHGTGCVLS